MADNLVSAQRGVNSSVNSSTSDNSSFHNPVVNGGLGPSRDADSNLKLGQHSEVRQKP